MNDEPRRQRGQPGQVNPVRSARVEPTTTLTPGKAPRGGHRYAEMARCAQCSLRFPTPPDATEAVCPTCQAANAALAAAQPVELTDAACVEEFAARSTAELLALTAPLDPVIARELAQRELVRRNLLDFTCRFNQKYQPGWVHKLICEKLDAFSHAVAHQQSPRLMIFMPPRHGKSELASVNFPAKHLGRYSDHEIIACSYAVSLPESFSRRIKQIIVSPTYQVLFPNTQLDPTAQATSGWHTLQGGGYLPAGVGGGITGRGANVLIIDDPVRDAEEADSEVTRDKVWDWYGSTARLRLSPGGGILVIQTRWSDDDLSGRILASSRALQASAVTRTRREEWDVLVFPAIAEHDEYWSKGRIVFDIPSTASDRLLRRKGEALHEERYSLDELLAQKSILQPRHWSALCQQNPVPDEGEFFKKSMFRFEPDIFRWQQGPFPTYVAWDLATSASRTACYIVGVVGCLDYDGNIHVLDMVRFRGSEGLVPSIIELYKKYKPKLLGIENGHILQAIRPQLTRIARTERLPISYDESLKPVSDKTMRAQPLQGIMTHGQLYLPSNQPWTEILQHEFLRFPGGTTDDIVDAMAWLVRMILKEPVPQRTKPKPPPNWRNKLYERLRGSRSRSNAALDA